jgi:hypothetical protein
MKPVLLCLTAALAIGLTACDGSPVEVENEALGTLQAKGGNGGGGNGGGGGGKGGGAITVSMSGDLVGEGQLISGKNSNRTLSAKGDYILTMNIDLVNLVCGNLPGTIPDSSGFVRRVQEATQAEPLLGTLDIKYDKTGPDAGRIDSWTTTIGQYKYWVQFFRWASAGLTENDVTTVSYRGGSIVVFKMKGKRFLAREQCFVDVDKPLPGFVNYDLIVN